MIYIFKKIFRMLLLVSSKISPVIICAAIIFIGSLSEIFPNEIEWKLYLRPYMTSGPIISTITQEGESFIIDNSDISGYTSGSEEILNALDGTSFLIQKIPVNNPLSIHIIFNVQGNSFENIMGIDLSLNMNIEAYINGSKVDNQYFFQNSPLIMTIPAGSGLKFLMEQSNCDRNEIIFGYYPGGKFEKDGIETYAQVQGVVVYINKLSNIIGGKNSDLGFSSNIKYDTWFKIKKLFE